MAEPGASLWRRLRRLGVPGIEPEPPPFIRTPFGASFQRLYDEAESEWARHTALCRRWTRLHYFFGLATVILAAISGFGGLGDLFSRLTAAWFALAAAVVAAVSTFLQADEQRKRHDELAAGWDDLRQYVYETYISAPDADYRLAYYRRFALSPEHSDETPTPPPTDPAGWQLHIRKLQEVARLLRRNRTDFDGTPLAADWNTK